MTTTGTTAFNLDISSLVEEAYERCGSEMRTGYDLRTARRSLNLLTIEWANRGINLWTVEEGSIPLISGTASYNLPVDTVDLLDHVVRTGTGTAQTDVVISRISSSTYSAIPTKASTGRPVQVWVDRLSGATGPGGIVYPKVHVWPVPDSTGTYTLIYWRLRRLQDAGNGTATQDVPFRFLPALVAGLAYYLAMKIPDAVSRLDMLQAEYERQWGMASDEDREKASLRIVPRMVYR